MIDFAKQEPAMLLSIVNAAIGVGVAFGLKINDTQKGALMIFFTLLIGYVIRHVVYSPATVNRILAIAGLSKQDVLTTKK